MKLKNVLLLALVAIMVIGVATGAWAVEGDNPFQIAIIKLRDAVNYAIGEFGYRILFNCYHKYYKLIVVSH